MQNLSSYLYTLSMAVIFCLATSGCNERCLDYGQYESAVIPPPELFVPENYVAIVPLEGVLVFNANPYASHPTDIEKLSLAVFDNDHQPVAGAFTIEREKQRVIWRAAAQLAPSTDYIVAITGLTSDYNDLDFKDICEHGCSVYTFKTTAAPAPAFEELALTNLQYHVEKLATEAQCCEADVENACNDFSYRSCAVKATQDSYSIDLDITLPKGTPHLGYLDINLEALDDVTLISEPKYLDGYLPSRLRQEHAYDYASAADTDTTRTETMRFFVSAQATSNPMFCFKVHAVRLTDGASPTSLSGSNVVDGDKLCIDQAQLQSLASAPMATDIDLSKCSSPLYRIDVAHPDEKLPVVLTSGSGGGLF